MLLFKIMCKYSKNLTKIYEIMLNWNNNVQYMVYNIPHNEHMRDRMLNRKQFDLLNTLSSASRSVSQRGLAALTGYSLGSVNKTLKELTNAGCIENGALTEKGFAALEPYRVKRAIFLAAGVGSRLMPITLNTPKPMVRVNGVRMIDGLIDACLAAGIEEIYVVRGYFAEQFDQLLLKYPMIRFIENPVFHETNDISSAYYARHLMRNAYVFESDLILHRDRLIKKYHYTSDFLGVYKERSDDWCFEVKDGVITAEKYGGLDCWQMIGISYWDHEDGAKLEDHIARAYELPGGRDSYWEQAPLTVFRDQYRVKIIPCLDGDVTEIDTYKELKAIDPAYAAFQ